MQKSINLALATAVVVLGAGLIASHVTRPSPLDETRMAALVDERVSQYLSDLPQPSAPTTDTADIGAVIETYLLDNPRLLERMSAALEVEVQAQERERATIALAALAEDIYDDPANIVLGNPDGDVTLVEMFDYNCGYCRQVVPDVLALIDEDPNLRVVLKEFPILSQGSVDAARIGILVNNAGADYTAFHTALFSSRGAITAETALAAAETVGLSRVILEMDMNTDAVTQAIQRTYAVAQGLGISGTPTFIIGNEVIPGALGKAELARRIANMRECGETSCPAALQDG